MKKAKLTSICLFIAGLVLGLGITFLPHTTRLFFGSPATKKLTPTERIQKKLNKVGVPVTTQFIARTNYCVGYDGKNRNPAWVYEHITEKNLKSGTGKILFKFTEDKQIPKHLRASLDDYRCNTHERGHLCPPADQRCSNEAMGDTFYLSNVSPQDRFFNQGYWKKIEKEVRSWVKQYKSLEVFTGPLYLPQEVSGKRQVTYDLIGPHDVSVPTHFYKLVLAKKKKGIYEIKAFIFPNQSIPMAKPLNEFTATLEEVEKLSGIFFFSNLRKTLEKRPGE